MNEQNSISLSRKNKENEEFKKDIYINSLGNEVKKANLNDNNNNSLLANNICQNIYVENFNISEFSTETQLVTFLKIQKFKKFLNEMIPFSTEEFLFHSPLINFYFGYRITLIPNKVLSTISVRIEFRVPFEDRESLKTYNKFFSGNKDKISIQLSCFSKTKRSFFMFKRFEHVLVNTNENTFVKEHYIKYDKDTLELGLIFPLILKIKISQYIISQSSDVDTGLINDNNMCYLNSIIQCVGHIPLLVNEIYNTKTYREKDLLFYLQKILYKLSHQNIPIKLNEEVDSGSNSSFLSVIPNCSDMKVGAQQDAQEIMGYIFDYLISLKDYKNDNKTNENENAFVPPIFSTNIFRESYIGSLKWEIVAQDINYKTENVEEFLFLSLDIPLQKNSVPVTLTSCLEKYFSVERLTGENGIKSEIDGLKHDATKSVSFKCIPPILFLHLKRFDINQRKILKEVIYEKELDLSYYFKDMSKDRKSSLIKYTLYSIIVHEGSINNGHYFIYLKDFKRNIWLKFNDSYVTIPVSETEVFQDNFGGTHQGVIITENNSEILSYDIENKRTAYILTYISNDNISKYMIEPQISIPKELEAKISQNKGQSFIMKFLERVPVIGNFINKNPSNHESFEKEGIIAQKTLPDKIIFQLIINNKMEIKEIVILLDLKKVKYCEDLKNLLFEQFSELVSQVNNIKFILINKTKIFLQMLDVQDKKYEINSFLFDMRNNQKSGYSIYIYQFDFSFSVSKMNNIFSIQKYEYSTKNVLLPNFYFDATELSNFFTKLRNYKISKITSSFDELKKATHLDQIKSTYYNENEYLNKKQVYRFLINKVI